MTTFAVPVLTRQGKPASGGSASPERLAECAGTLFRWGSVCATVCLLFPALAMAEEVHWRPDYATARKEAEKSGQPLFIDLGGENCPWCKKLDTTTLTEPEVVSVLNSRFIPVKINGDRDPYYAKALRITSYPTMVVADSSGKILRFQEGFLEAPALKDLLGKVLGSLKPPEWMVRDFEEANRAVTATDYPRALSLLRGVVEDGKISPVQQKAREVIQKLETQATELLTKARALATKGDTTKAADAINDLAKQYPGTQAARDGKMLAQEWATHAESVRDDRATRARELMKKARDEYNDSRYLSCLDRCEELIAQYGDLPEATQAAELSSEIKSNPEWTKSAADQTSDRLCVLYLALADTWLKRGQPREAIFYLERVVKSFPNSRHAEVAQTRLVRLQGAPSGH
jgi:thioredoxin-like negative regulator of GroEL